MKTKLMCLMALLPYLLLSQTNDFRFAHSFPGEDPVHIMETKALKGGGYVVIGNFENDVTIGDTTLHKQYEHLNYTETFLACFTENHQLKWLKQYPATSLGYESLETDSRDNIYIGFAYAYDSINLVDTTLYAMGHWGSFIARYSPYGHRTLLQNINSNQVAFVNDLKTDDQDNLYFSALVSQHTSFIHCNLYFNDTVLHDEGEFRAVVKQDTAGNLLFIKKFPYPGTSQTSSNSTLHLTKDNELYFFEANTHGIVCGSDTFDIKKPFLMKLDEAGDYKWVKAMPELSYPLRENCVFSDQNNTIYISGTAIDTTIIGNDTLIHNDPEKGLIIYKTDPEGSLLWYEELQNGKSTGAKLAFDAKNNLYLSYAYKGEINMGDTSLQSYWQNVLVTKINTEGEYEWVVSSTGSTTADVIDLLTDSEDDLWLSGYYSNNIYFADTMLTGPTGWYRGFLVKVNTCLKEFSLGNDTLVKLSDTLILKGIPGFDEYVWSTGSNEEQIAIIADEYGPGVHDFYLTAFDAYCTYSDTLKVSIIDDAAVNEFQAGSFHVFPNPARSRIQLTSSSNEKVENIYILSPDGRIMLTSDNPTEYIDISSLRPGYYLVRIQCREDIYQAKLIVSD